MNTKLIKGCKITRISQERRFEPAVKTSAPSRIFWEIFAFARPQLAQHYCLQLRFGLEK